MSLKHGILGLLNYSPMTGYELMKTFNRSLIFFWSAQTSQIYRELNTLEKGGFLDSEIVVQSGKPNKKIYSINNSGKEEFLKWLSKPVSEFSAIRDPIIMKLFFTGEGTKDNALVTLRDLKQVFQEFRDSTKKYHGIIHEFSETLTPEKLIFWEMIADYAVQHAEGLNVWINSCIEKLDKLEKSKGSQ